MEMAGIRIFLELGKMGPLWDILVISLYLDF